GLLDLGVFSDFGPSDSSVVDLGIFGVNSWERCNSIVLSWLLNSVSEDMFFGYIFFDNASEPIRSSLLSRETLPDVKDAFAIVSREESHRGLDSPSSGFVTKP
nr:ribonuclease H-like domain-containing protein [Tanacetum cinerariifolium]